MKMRFFIQPLVAALEPKWVLGPIAQEYFNAPNAYAYARTNDNALQVSEDGFPLPHKYTYLHDHPAIQYEQAISDVTVSGARQTTAYVIVAASKDVGGYVRLRAAAAADYDTRASHLQNYGEFNYVECCEALTHVREEAREEILRGEITRFMNKYSRGTRSDQVAFALSGDWFEANLSATVALIRRTCADQPHLVAALAEGIYTPNCGYDTARRQQLRYRMAKALSAGAGRQPPASYLTRSQIMDQLRRRRAVGEMVSDIVTRARRDGDYITADALLEVAAELESHYQASKVDDIMANIQYNLVARGADFDRVIRADCGHWSGEDDVREVHPSGRRWCEECADERTVQPADRDGEDWDRNYVYSHSDGEYRTYEEEEEPDDDECDAAHGRTSCNNPDWLMNYSTNVLEHVRTDKSFTPTPSGDLLMGIELELIMPGRQGAYIPGLRQDLGTDYAVFKADGSLDQFGAELVTAPRKLEDHIAKFTAVEFPRHSKAWDAGCCGMHVHIDSRGFTAMSLGKFVQFINDEDNADLIRKIAGRHPSRDEQADEYCSAIDQGNVVNPARAKGGYPNRYRMVNLTGLHSDEADRLGVSGTDGKFNTIELRIFRASLRKERLLAQLEFTHASVMFCRVESYRNLKAGNFLRYLTKNHFLYPNLAKWFSVVVPKPTAQRPEVQRLSVDTAHDL